MINEPLRREAERRREVERAPGGDEGAAVHPLPLTTWLIADALPKLRTVEASDSARATRELHLYRGIANAVAEAEFRAQGGSEIAPMSTTSDRRIAVQVHEARL